eukprot:08174.XXX_241224_241508_1 [CDS] Oithona nana genome sequencing.
MKGPTLMGFFSIKMKKGKEVILSPFSRPILYSFYRFTFEEYEGSSTVGIKGVKSTAMDRGYRRMHIAPYVRPK